MNCKIIPFSKAIKPIKYTTKIKRCDYLDMGNYPIISQEKQLINGYWNNIKDVYKVTSPIVIFGDHTKVIKYIDFDFVLGADGVKILSPIDDIIPKFFYYQILSFDLDKLGYARHYKLLTQQNIIIPEYKEQKRIIEVLDKIQDQEQKIENNYKQVLIECEALKMSILRKAMNGEL